MLYVWFLRHLRRRAIHLTQVCRDFRLANKQSTMQTTSNNALKTTPIKRSNLTENKFAIASQTHFHKPNELIQAHVLRLKHTHTHTRNPDQQCPDYSTISNRAVNPQNMYP